MGPRPGLEGSKGVGGIPEVWKGSRGLKESKEVGGISEVWVGPKGLD